MNINCTNNSIRFCSNNNRARSNGKNALRKAIFGLTMGAALLSGCSCQSLNAAKQDTFVSTINTTTTTTNPISQIDKNYKIDKNQQGDISDCWLLSVLNSLNYCKDKNILNDVLDYQDGFTNVHLACGNYKITDEEVEDAQGRFACGDKDVNIIELAVEKALDDYNCEVVDFPSKLCLEKQFGNSTSSLNNGYEDIALYLLGCSNPIYYKMSQNKETINSQLEEFKQGNPNNLVLIVANGTNETKSVNTIQGDKIYISKHHSMSVVDVDDEGISLINPTDSSKTFKLSKDEFERVFTNVVYGYFSG